MQDMNTMNKIKKVQVTAWLDILGCTPTVVEDKKTNWHLDFDYPKGSGQRMHVVQPKGKELQIVIATGVNVSHQHRGAFYDLDADEKKEFGLSLRRVLNRPEVDFQLEGASTPSDCPTRFQLSRTRFADGLSLDSFAETVGFVFKAKLHAIWHFEDRLGDHRSGFGGQFNFKSDA